MDIVYWEAVDSSTYENLTLVTERFYPEDGWTDKSVITYFVNGNDSYYQGYYLVRMVRLSEHVLQVQQYDIINDEWKEGNKTR